MPILKEYDTPASVRDLPEGSEFYQVWSEFVSRQIDESTPGPVTGGEFYNATKVDVNEIGSRMLTWMALPRQELIPRRDDRDDVFRVSEDRDLQNEYCEWVTTRNEEGKITRVVFVTETPEYFEQLWEFNPSEVAKLYSKILKVTVEEGDLDDGNGCYKRKNRWNNFGTNEIVHLIQDINTLDAALGLAQGAASTTRINDNYEFSNPAITSVDARVPIDVASLVRKGLSITLSDPIGLYIVDWNDVGWTKPNGRPVGDYWRVTRGCRGQAMRLEYEVPEKEGFVVGDIRIGGRPILYGSQLAEHVTVAIAGTAGTRASLSERDAPAGLFATTPHSDEPLTREALLARKRNA
ncbi:MAG: hypothetical protein AAGD07_12950 [Planctomycetota bacterium]